MFERVLSYFANNQNPPVIFRERGVSLSRWSFPLLGDLAQDVSGLRIQDLEDDVAAAAAEAGAAAVEAAGPTPETALAGRGTLIFGEEVRKLSGRSM